MAASLRFGSALSIIALASVVGGCASPGERVARASGDANANTAYATRAQMALNSQDFASAVTFAERAVERSPSDATLRTLLGNAYFGSGRFASAEAAYRDSLALAANQPQVVLKLALVEIAQGRGGEAVPLLESARRSLSPSDYGLALALAGEPARAVEILDAAAREQGADAQVRQNLALAYALTGDWTNAKLIAAQDLSADLVNARVQQWMAFAKPTHPSDQVAALLGVRPIAGDPGQPVQLALNSGSSDIRTAAVAPVAVASPVMTAAAPASAPVIEAPVAVAAAPVAPVAATPVTHAAAPVPAPVAVAAKAPGTPAPAFAEATRRPSALTLRKARAPIQREALSRALGKSTSVVQIGAYASAQRVGAAWSQVSSRYAALQGYTPVSARFDGPQGTVYRLSVKGFSSAREAQALCASLKGKGGTCFVRTVAGDAPVRLASR